MTSWSKCSLPSHRVLGLTSTQKPRGTSSPEISSALTSKLRNHQIFRATKSSTAAVAAAIMPPTATLHVRGAGAGADESGLIQSAFFGSFDDVVDGSCLSKLRSEFVICLESIVGTNAWVIGVLNGKSYMGV
ncbi:hypothetical protein CFP56_026476 [Quercus suber]|uniref:Uncharacterized protein n=1 Tax=Quercus suber TaxID=58331 RepID=A0AAW0LVZ6_QUESU